jgi:hypothetical protein
MVLGQKSPRIWRRHLFWNTSTSFLLMVVMVFQHSDPYKRTLRTLLLDSDLRVYAEVGVSQGTINFK